MFFADRGGKPKFFLNGQPYNTRWDRIRFRLRNLRFKLGWWLYRRTGWDGWLLKPYKDVTG